MASSTAAPGRPRESGVWQYFKYCEEENKCLFELMELDVAAVSRENF